MTNAQAVAVGTEARIPINKERFFKNILLTTDFSPVSEQALEYAASLARRYGSTIFLTHVISLDGYPLMAPELAASSAQKMRADAEEGFRNILKSGRLMSLPFQTVVQEGNLWPVIEESMQKYAIDLVIVGTHGIGAIKKLLIGSGAEEIFRKAKVPVLIVGPATDKETPYELELKNILFATDFGKGTEREAEYAFSLAQEHHSRLRLVHVFPHPEAYGDTVLTIEKEACRNQLRELVPTPADLHCIVDFEIPTGEPVEEILRIADETKADLIVMGAKARTSLAGNVPHTKAYRVVTGARCPVLTIRS